MMRVLLPALLPLAMLAGCAGHIADYVGPRSNIVSPQLLRFGLNVAQARCVADRLAATLTPRQLRLFARAAGAVTRGYHDPARLTMRDLLWVANAMGDGGVARALSSADAACGVSQALDFVRQTHEAAAAAASREAEAASAAAAPRPTAWLNLGAAGSGQSIAVDASTIAEEGHARTAWFRMTDPGAAAPGDNAYLLRVDCARRTINAKARERRDAAGAPLERVDYPDNPLPVEGGTVMEIAFLAMCT